MLFDSSRKRRSEFTFTLKGGMYARHFSEGIGIDGCIWHDLGKVIEAWELAIPNMKVGEKAEITCTSNYGELMSPSLLYWLSDMRCWCIGYGDEGRQYIVPPKAKLRFEVELLGFWEVNWMVNAC